jgi:hypothetical protein
VSFGFHAAVLRGFRKPFTHIMPITRTLEKIAKATGSKLKISFEPNTV